MNKLSICSSYIVLIAININTLWAAEKNETAAKIDAAEIYVQNCAICHGDKGDAKTRAQSGLRPPPKDFTTIEAALELSRERMIDSVTNGRKGTAMMAHKGRLSAAQIEAVVDYIRQDFMQTPEDQPVLVKNNHGAEIYSRNCAVCHGDKGNTAIWARSGLNPAPKDFTSEEARKTLTRDRMIDSVTNGRPGTGMMSFTTKLNKQEIEQVVDYIQQAFMSSATAPSGLPQGPYANQPVIPQDRAHAGVGQNRDPHAGLTQQRDPHAGPHQGGMPAMASRTMPVIDADMSLPFPNGLEGDPIEGRKFFMGNCFTCHGVTGEGDGPRASFNIPRPRNFTSEESRRTLNRVRLHKGITDGKVGTVMPAWGKVLTDQQITNVAEFVFQAFIRSKDYPEISGDKSANNKPDKKKAQ